MALSVQGPWTVGLLANHVWSVGETDDFDSFFVERPQINSTFLQPFVNYGVGNGLSVGFNTESTYDWEGEQWTVPLALFASQVIQIGGQTVSLSPGLRWYVEGADNAPDWGARLAVVLVYPRCPTPPPATARRVRNGASP